MWQNGGFIFFTFYYILSKFSVNVLQLSRTKRHLDRAILQRFWEILDRHIAKSSKRDWLRY